MTLRGHVERERGLPGSGRNRPDLVGVELHTEGPVHLLDGAGQAHRPAGRAGSSTVRPYCFANSPTFSRSPGRRHTWPRPRRDLPSPGPADAERQARPDQAAGKRWDCAHFHGDGEALAGIRGPGQVGIPPRRTFGAGKSYGILPVAIGFLLPGDPAGGPAVGCQTAGRWHLAGRGPNTPLPPGRTRAQLPTALERAGGPRADVRSGLPAGRGGSGRRGAGPGLVRIRSRWERTVRMLMYSWAAIWASVRPWATRVTSSRSRELSFPGPGATGVAAPGG